MRRVIPWLLSTCALLRVASAPPTRAAEPAWPQFRGQGGLGIAPDQAKLPVEFGPAKNVLWKTELPSGLSSPCIWGQRIFLTGFDARTKKLETLCLDRRTGKVLWRKAAPAQRIEKVQATSSPATATPATDGARIYISFGSYGLLCYDFEGNEKWNKPLPIPRTRFGSGTSPVVAGGVVLYKHQGEQGGLFALDPRTGAEVWKKERLAGDPGASVPLVVSHKGGNEVIIHGERGIRAYDLKDGKERWSRSALFCAAIPSPILAEGLLFFVNQFPGGDQDDPLKLPDFDEMLKKYDKDKDGKLGRDEVKDVVLYSRDGTTREGNIMLSSFFAALDRDGDGKLSRFEWGFARFMVGIFKNSLLAVRPGASGALSSKQIVWTDNKSLPEISTPLCYQGRLYLVKHNGILSCLEAKSGKLLFRQRLGATGLYYASPVAGDGKVYVPSLRGVVTVLQAADKLKVLARNDLGEAIGATPAVLEGVLYVRTNRRLYAFKE
jgi:outer membrane protein assembly factor BamB